MAFPSSVIFQEEIVEMEWDVLKWKKSGKIQVGNAMGHSARSSSEDKICLYNQSRPRGPGSEYE